MKKTVYLSLVGRYAWAVVNSYYAVLKKERCHPDFVHLVIEKSYNHDIDKLVNSIEIISKEFGLKINVETTTVDDASFAPAGKTLLELYHSYQEKEHSIALDITPGRKALVAAALIASTKTENIAHVFYLAVKDQGLADLPYMLKPTNLQRLQDLLTHTTEDNQ